MNFTVKRYIEMWSWVERKNPGGTIDQLDKVMTQTFGEPKWTSHMGYGEGSIECEFPVHEITGSSSGAVNSTQEAYLSALDKLMKLSHYKCVVAPIHFEKTPTALAEHNLRLAKVNGNQVVVGDHYDEGTLGFFIPAGVKVPKKLLEEMWLWNELTGKGRLAGKAGDIVKKRELEGFTSEGLFYGSRYFIMEESDKKYVISPSWKDSWNEGHDVAEELGFTIV